MNTISIEACMIFHRETMATWIRKNSCLESKKCNMAFCIRERTTDMQKLTRTVNKWKQAKTYLIKCGKVCDKYIYLWQKITPHMEDAIMSTWMEIHTKLIIWQAQLIQWMHSKKWVYTDIKKTGNKNFFIRTRLQETATIPLRLCNKFAINNVPHPLCS